MQFQQKKYQIQKYINEMYVIFYNNNNKNQISKHSKQQKIQYSFFFLFSFKNNQQIDQPWINKQIKIPIKILLQINTFIKQNYILYQMLSQHHHQYEQASSSTSIKTTDLIGEQQWNQLLKKCDDYQIDDSMLSLNGIQNQTNLNNNNNLEQKRNSSQSNMNFKLNLNSISNKTFNNSNNTTNNKTSFYKAIDNNANNKHSTNNQQYKSRLLSNQFFSKKFTSSKSNQQSQEKQIDNKHILLSSNQYLNEYNKWKQQQNQFQGKFSINNNDLKFKDERSNIEGKYNTPSFNRLSSNVKPNYGYDSNQGSYKKSMNNLDYKFHNHNQTSISSVKQKQLNDIEYCQQILKLKAEYKEKMKKILSTNYNEPINYQQQIAQATNKDNSQVDQKNKSKQQQKIPNQSPSQQNERNLQFQLENSSLQQSFTSKSSVQKYDYFEQKQLNQFCFADMIKRKPNFVRPNQKKNIAKQDYQQLQQSHIDSQRHNKITFNQQEDISESQLRQEKQIQQIKDQLLYDIKNSRYRNQNNHIYEQSQYQINRSKQNINQVSRRNSSKKYDFNNLNNLKSLSYNQNSQKPNPQYTSKTFPKLNIQKLLKMPYKQFLFFFEQNQRNIIKYCPTAQDYRRLEMYRNKCIEHMESIQKLRERFTSEKGARLLNQLSTEQKQKLWRVLYQNQIN